MFKNILILLVVLFIFQVNKLTAQDFKPVTTAQDVIDNYITANGGEENMKKIKNITMTGTVSAMGILFPLTVFYSMDYFYMKSESEMFGFTQVVDFKKQKGWMSMMGQVKDLTKEELAQFEKTRGGALWKHYLEKEKYNVTYNLLQDDTADGKDCYVVEFLQKDSVMYSVYFDKKTYHRLKQVDDKNTINYYDIKEAGTSGIYLPFKINQAQGLVNVTKYEFNKKFDKKLLQKPEEK